MGDTRGFADLSDLPREVKPELINLVMAQYEDLVAAVRSNEELGERRLDAYLTVIAAVTAAVGLAAGGFESDLRPLIAMATVAAVLLVTFGVMTFKRVIERNVTTTTYLNALRRIRAFFAQSQPEIVSLFAFPPEHEPLRRRRGKPERGLKRFGIGKGGLLETVAALNSVLISVVAGGAAWLLGTPMEAALAIGTGAAAASWAAHLLAADRVYESINAERDDERAENLAAWFEWMETRDGR
jgi:hypothetical protein